MLIGILISIYNKLECVRHVKPVLCTDLRIVFAQVQ